MSGCLVERSGAVELLFYDELGQAARAELEEHLARCSDCRRTLADLRLIQAALAARPDVCAPAGGDWTAFMTRVSAAVSAEGTAPPARPSQPVGGFVGYFAMAALLVLVTLGVAYLAQSRNTARHVQAARTPAASADAERERPWSVDAAFASLSEQHFLRSKLVVLGLLNKDPNATPDWEYERQLAAALLSDTRLYRQAAEERGLTRLARIMDDLELVLLQTSTVAEPQPETLEQIQRLIEKRDLITKMNVVTTVAGL